LISAALFAGPVACVSPSELSEVHTPKATFKKLHPFSKLPASWHGEPAALFRLRPPCADSCDCGIRTDGHPVLLESTVITAAVGATCADSLHDLDFVVGQTVEVIDEPVRVTLAGFTGKGSARRRQRHNPARDAEVGTASLTVEFSESFWAGGTGRTVSAARAGQRSNPPADARAVAGGVPTSARLASAAQTPKDNRAPCCLGHGPSGESADCGHRRCSHTR
jgi:hypothetical protein